MQIPSSNIDCVFLHPNDDEPGILFWLSDNTTKLNVFGDEAECATAWQKIQDDLSGEDFVRYHEMIFRPERLRYLKKNHTPEFGNAIEFTFANDSTYTQLYNSMESLEKDLAKLTEILATLIEIRASRRFRETQQ